MFTDIHIRKIPSDLYQKAKACAALRGVTVSAWIAGLMEREVRLGLKQPTATLKAETAAPTAKVAKPRAVRLI